MKLYLDTPVFGGYFDIEFEAYTVKLSDLIQTEKINIVYSGILELELKKLLKRLGNLSKIR
jgi:hypothetical protein